jgi:anti-anti-sigma regulatory factor
VTYMLPRVTEVSTVVLEGEIDPAAVLALQRRLGAALHAGQRRIVVDLGAVTVLGAQTVSRFCAMLRRLTGGGATVAIVGAPVLVRRVLELWAIDGLELYPSVSAALSRPCPDRAARPAAFA